jgi:hypothetical protein
MDPSVKAYLMSQGLYECTLGGYPSKDSGNNTYNVFYGIRQKIGKAISNLGLHKLKPGRFKIFFLQD